MVVFATSKNRLRKLLTVQGRLERLLTPFVERGWGLVFPRPEAPGADAMVLITSALTTFELKRLTKPSFPEACRCDELRA